MNIINTYSSPSSLSYVSLAVSILALIFPALNFIYNYYRKVNRVMFNELPTATSGAKYIHFSVVFTNAGNQDVMIASLEFDFFDVNRTAHGLGLRTMGVDLPLNLQPGKITAFEIEGPDEIFINGNQFITGEENGQPVRELSLTVKCILSNGEKCNTSFPLVKFYPSLTPFSLFYRSYGASLNSINILDKKYVHRISL